ncbi:TPA: hypothetical protein ACMUAF_002629 [Enterococcus faecalis]|uniref:hypothetical protein n=1 Tax=Enterococcus faecalis TaxID=1351 RepID=UPI001F026D4A|nr:hypothetical protein [Enterococcus faecalis]HAP3873427.1 hypothetical protein [Enterococcus faecalis]
MTVEVEILSSNVEVLEKQPPLELLPFADFIEITRCMYVKEAVTFQLLEVGGDPFYRGSFEKLNDEWTLEKDIQKKLNQLVKKKKMTAEQAEGLLYKIPFKNLQEASFSNEKKTRFFKKEKKPQNTQKVGRLNRKIHDISPIKLSQKQLRILGVFVIGILLIVIGWKFMAGSQSTAKTSSEPTYQQLVNKEKYAEIVKKYPEKEPELIEELFQKEDKAGLKKIAEHSNTQLAQLYLAFLEKDWQKVTELSKLPQDSDVQAMVGYAFLEQGKIEEAKLINKEIQNDTLTKQIKSKEIEQAYKLLRERKISEAERINERLKDNGLSEAIKVAKSIHNLLEKYAKDKENKELSENERKEAADNYQLWLKNLEQIGKSVH